MSFGTLLRSFLLALGLVALSGCGINSVPTAEEEAKARWADVQSAYQRRADLIPNLVEVVRGAASSEQDILTQVIEARASATQTQLTTDDLSDPAAIQRFDQAQSQLGGALSRLLVTVEKYPELQSQARFADLMVQLEGSENRIEVARNRYNEAVQNYNTTIRTFPATIAANVIYGAEPMEGFQAQPGSENAPDVDFGGLSGGSGAAAPANDNTGTGATQNGAATGTGN
ncbi:MAG: LemA family protein [Erythrobacter sp.]|nr:LemA family protein [Erythrobacter sp.]NCQ64879.1 LemA family protein [Alphaproteobacteria bacterium]